MIDELVMDARGRDAYVTGPKPEKVRIEGVTTQAAVAVYDPVSKRTAVGYFSNLRQSEEFERMLGMVQVDWDLDSLVVTLIGSLFGKTSIGPSNGFEPEDKIYALAVLEQMGIPRNRISERHLSHKAPSAVDLSFNMKRGTIQVRRQPIMEQYFEVPDPSEPNDEMLWLNREHSRR